MKQRVIIVCATLSLVCLGAWAIQAQTSSSGQDPAATLAGKSVAAVDPAHIAVNRQTSVDCNLCFTCGGDWPIFAGAIPALPNNLFVLNAEDPTERGNACAGGLILRNDTRPFLCCK
jgi:hypothetical protein